MQILPRADFFAPVLDGEIIYKYPLKKAEEEDYFKLIRFRPIVIEAIAKAAIEQLRADFGKGHKS